MAIEAITYFWKPALPQRPQDVARRHHNLMAKKALAAAARSARGKLVRAGGNASDRTLTAKFITGQACKDEDLQAAFDRSMTQQLLTFRTIRKRVRVTRLRNQRALADEVRQLTYQSSTGSLSGPPTSAPSRVM